MSRIYQAGTLYLVLFWSVSFSQTQLVGRIVGKVVDDTSGAGLPFVNVRIDGTTLGNVTDADGRFAIPSVPYGARTIFVSRIGYVLTSLKVSVTDTLVEAPLLRLKPKSIDYEPTEVVGDRTEWQAKYSQFVRLLIGNTPNAVECKILNPEVISFSGSSADELIANSDEPIQIENRALGYIIGLSIEKFSYESKRMTTWFMTSFRELSPQDDEQKQSWANQRRRTFNGSQRHFLISLFRSQLNVDGFKVFSVSSFDRREALHKGLIESHILAKGSTAYQKRMNIRGILEVEYTKEELPEGYDLRKRSDTRHQVSWLEINSPSITLNHNGSIEEFMPFVAHGYWAWVRMGEQLPEDYIPD